MIYELRTYNLQAQKTREYGRILEEQGQHVLAPFWHCLQGWFYTESGPLNQVVSLWKYESWEERGREREEAVRRTQLPEFATYVPSIVPLVQSMESKILAPFPFSPMK